jgi:uncharacterized protein
MAIIFDSSPLIGITKIGKLDMLRRLYGKVLIPRAVYREVIIEGKRLRKLGVEVIESAIQAGWVETVSLTRIQLIKAQKYRTNHQIDKGEAEAISLAEGRKLPIIIDDKFARETAHILNIQYKGTAAVLLEAYLKNLLNRKEFLQSLEALSLTIWLSPEVITRLLQLAEERK